MVDTFVPEKAIGLSPVGRVKVVDLMPMRLRCAMDDALKVVAEQKLDRFVDLSDPRVIEVLTYAALRNLGYEFVDDLTLARRPPVGCMSRKARIEWMAASDDETLRYAAHHLIPRTRKGRYKNKRMQSNRLPQWELAKLTRLVRLRRVRVGASHSIRSCVNELVDILALIGLEYDVEHVRDAWRAELNK